MSLTEELISLLHEMLTLELNIRLYLREWKAQVSDTAVRTRLEELDAHVGPEADRLAQCLEMLGDRPRFTGTSLLLEAFREPLDRPLVEAAALNDLRGVVTLLALTHTKISLYQSMVAMAETQREHAVSKLLHESLSRLQHDVSHLQELQTALLAQAVRRVWREAA